LLTEKIVRAGPKFANVYGIPRGGLVVAVVLCHRLGLPLLTDAEKVGPDTLVVDDICDSGRALSPYVGRCTTATLHVVPSACVRPDFFARICMADWVKYPWEVK
jgi:hypoxanthine phosphoribosyltransferase